MERLHDEPRHGPDEGCPGVAMVVPCSSTTGWAVTTAGWLGRWTRLSLPSVVLAEAEQGGRCHGREM